MGKKPLLKIAWFMEAAAIYDKLQTDQHLKLCKLISYPKFYQIIIISRNPLKNLCQFLDIGKVLILNVIRYFTNYPNLLSCARFLCLPLSIFAFYIYILT